MNNNDSRSFNDGLLISQGCDDNALVVGSYFNDVTSFNQVLQSTGITNNFGITIKVSDKTHVIVTCWHR